MSTRRTVLLLFAAAPSRRSDLFLATTALAALALTPGEASAQGVGNRDGGSYGGSNNCDTGGGDEQAGCNATGGGGGAGTATTRGNGGAGANGNGGGGVGGINGMTAATLSGLSIVGGRGGDGLAGVGANRGGGGGGAGGYGYVLTAAGNHTTTTGQTIVGGAGGNGGLGTGTGSGGGGGDGGVGLFLQVGGGFTNVAGATVTGGIGGSGSQGNSGTGGTGLLTSGGGLRGYTGSPRTPIFEPTFAATVSNAGTIAGGVGGASVGGASASGASFFNSGQGGIGVHLLGIGTLTNNASGLITGGGGGAAFAGSPTVTATGGGSGGDGVTLGRALPQGAESRTVVNEGRIQGGSGAAGAIAAPLSRPGDGGAFIRFNFLGGTGGAGVTAMLSLFGSVSGAGAAEIRYTITNAAAGLLVGGAGGAGGVGPASDGATTTLAGSNGGDGGPGVSHFGEPGLVVGGNVDPSRVANAFGSGTLVGNIVNQGRIVGGAGGRGGVAIGGTSGDSGNGGAGVRVSGGSLTITNGGTIQGGDGAAGVGGAAGRGGVGVDLVGSNPIIVCPAAPDPVRGFACNPPVNQADVVIVYLNRANATIVNSGTIAGGLNGDGTRAPAIVFDAGVHTLRLLTGATFIGDVIVNPFTTRTIPANLTFGPLTISEGGNPADNTLDLDGASTGTVSLPQFINFGNLTQTGGAGGRWTLTGAGTFSVRGSVAAGAMVIDPAATLTTPAFTVLSGGTLLLNGSLVGATRVDAGGRLGGNGRLGNLDLAGTLAAGNSVGTLTATGNVVIRAGSTFELEIAAAGGGDRLTATGTATIEGGTVRVLTLDPDTQYVGGTRYTFLTAAGGRTGTFAALTETSAFLDFTLGYDATSAFVTVNQVRMFPDVALTFNQRQASTALMGFNTLGGADGLAVYNQLLMLDAAPARAAFDASSGEIYPVLVAAEQRRSAGLSQRLLARANGGFGTGWGLWADASLYDGRTDADGNGARFGQDGFGGAIGVDYRGPSNGWALGVTGGIDQSDVTLRDRASAADRDGWHLGAYGRLGTGGAGLSATISGSYSTAEADVTRTIVLGALSRTARANVDVDSWAVGGEARYGFALRGGWSIGPQARIVHAAADLDSFAETGAGSLSVSGAGGNNDSRTRYGGGLFARWESERGFIDASVAYAGGGDSATEIGLAMAGAPATRYRLRAARGDGDAAELTLAGGLELGGGWWIGANAGAAWGSRERTLQGNAAIDWRF